MSVFSLQTCGFALTLLAALLVVRSVCQSLSAARWPEDQQEEDVHQEGRHQPHLQRGHDLLSAVHRPAGGDETLAQVKHKDFAPQ